MDLKLLRDFKKYAWLAMKASCLKKDVRNMVIPGIYAKVGISFNELVLHIQADELSEQQWLSRKNDLVDYPEIKGGKVDKEFYSNFLKTQGVMAKKLASISMDTGISRIVLAAYGIGAVYGIFTMLQLLTITHDLTIDIYTYGQPHIGNRIFALYINQIKSFMKITRITFKDDFVPRMPVNKYHDYLHHMTEVWIASEDCSCLKEERCNNRFRVPNIRSHRGPYFGYKMGVCIEAPPPFQDVKYAFFGDEKWTTNL
ncbi:hypothetical protein G9A89_002848 [Geosiphon pyriformis]|nr:hypothetical protein G9A89_002848 [Geosiphon pyriformis]